MLNRIVSLTAAAAIGLSVPALATAQASKPGAPAAAAGQASPTRTTLLNNLNGNFKTIDLNGDGFLNIQEVNAAELKRTQQASLQIQNRIGQEFNKLDTDKNGSLSLAEFRAAARQVPPPTPASSRSISSTRTRTARSAPTNIARRCSPTSTGSTSIATA